MTYSRHAGGWLLGLLGLFYSGPTQARPQPSPQELSRLAERVDTANRLFEEKKYAEALPVYQDIYERSREPTMLFSMGQCYRNMSKFQQAADAYQGFLKAAPQEHELRPLADQLLKEVEAKLPSAEAPRPKSRILYLGGGGVGLVGVTAGATAIGTILAAGKKQDAGELDDALRLEQRATLFAAVADVAVVASLGLVIGGFVLSKKEKKTTSTLSVGPSQLTLRLEF